MNMRQQTLLLLILLIFQLSAFSQTAQHTAIDLENGDLLFVGAKKEHLSGAINRVTQTQTHIAFDHVALIEVADEGVFLIHATGENGTVREPMHHYLSKQASKQTNLLVYRLVLDYQSCIPNAILEAKKWLGKPYNWSYVLNDSSIYCSDLIERSFRACSLFDLKPMTFKHPATDTFDEFWVRFYDNLGIPIPEGQPGCNPNGLAASDKLFVVGQLR